MNHKNKIILSLFPILMTSALFGASLTVDLGTIVNPAISPMVFGVNAGVFDGPYDSTYNTQASNLIDAGVKSIRMPGGTVSDTYDWYRTYWEGGSSGNWYGGPTTLTVKTFCDSVGAELWETVNLGMCFGPAEGLQFNADPYWNYYPYGIFPTKPPVGSFFASQWVKYANVDLGTAYSVNPAHSSSLNMKYWEVGNEPDLGMCNYIQYYQKFREYATAMKQVDPTIKMAGPTIANLLYAYAPTGPFTPWMTNLLSQCGDVVDILSLHRYPPWNSSYATLLNYPQEWDSWIPLFNSFIQKYSVNKWGRTPGDVKIAITEWSSGVSMGNSSPMGELLYIADTLGEYIKNGVYIAHYWALQNNTFLPLEGWPPGFAKMAPHYSFKFMSTHVKSRLVKSTSDNVSLTTYCSRYSNFISLVVVNKSTSLNIASSIAFNASIVTQADIYETTTAGNPTITHINNATSNFNWTFKKYSLTCIKVFLNNNYETVPPSTPHLVSPLDSSAVLSPTPLLVWTKSTDASGITNYTVEISSSPSFSTFQQTAILKATNYAAGMLHAGIWFWRVRATDKYFNDGTNSAVWSFFVSPPTTPQLVNPLDSADVFTATPLLIWQHSTALSGISNYSVQVSSSPVFSSTQQSGVTKLTNFQSAFLSAGIWYWRVRAKDKDLNVSTNSVIRSFFIVPPSTPQLISPFNGVSMPVSSLVLVWNSSVAWSGVSNYTVEISPGVGFGSIQKTGLIKSTNYTVNSLPNGTWYWRVRALDRSLNPSTNSAVRSFTLTAPLPSTPILVSPSNTLIISTPTPVFAWNRSTGTAAISNYTVEISSSSVFAGDQQIGFTSFTNYTATALLNKTWYWRVTAMDKNMNFGTNSPGWSFTIIAPPPSTPQQISPLPGATVLSSTPLLVWKSSVSPTGISNYIIQISSSPVFSSTQQIRVSRSTNYWPNPLPEGTWYWRVRSMDKNSLSGTNTASRSFVVENTIPIKGATYYQSGIFKSGSQQLTNSMQAVFPYGYSTVPVNFSAFFTNSGGYSKSSMNSNFIGSYEFMSSQLYSDIPVQFTLKFSPQLIPSGHTESQIALYSYNGIEWVKIEGTLDMNNNIFIFNSNKLTGEYAFFVTNPNYLMTTKKPSMPDVSQWSYNPFSPNGDNKSDVTRMELNIKSPSKLTLRIYDRDRRLVRDLVSGTKVSGQTYVEWDGKDDNGKVVAPGAYIYMIKINETLRKGVIVVVY